MAEDQGARYRYYDCGMVLYLATYRDDIVSLRSQQIKKY